MTGKTVDIVIPTYHLPADFADLLNSLSRQRFPAGNIIIMHTLSEDEELPSFPGFGNVSVYPVRETEFDHGKTRDEGLKKSSATHVLFLTQDVKVRDEFLVENLLKAFEDPETAAAYGKQEAGPGASPVEAITRKFNYPDVSSVKTRDDIERLGIKTFFLSDVCAMYDRETYLELGGFITKTIFNEDMIFAHKIIMSGKKVAYCADARVEHYHNYTGMQQLRRNFDLGVSQKDHPEVFENISSEKEGASLVKNTVKELFRMKKPFGVFRLVYLSGMKYVGYRLGKAYRRLPEGLVRKLSMNKNYWR